MSERKKKEKKPYVEPIQEAPYTLVMILIDWIKMINDNYNFPSTTWGRRLWFWGISDWFKKQEPSPAEVALLMRIVTHVKLPGPDVLDQNLFVEDLIRKIDELAIICFNEYSRTHFKMASNDLKSRYQKGEQK